MADELLDDDLQERKATQGLRTRKVFDIADFGDAVRDAMERRRPTAEQDPLGAVVRATVCAKDDGGSHIEIAFSKDELADPSYAGRKFGAGAKVRLKRDAFIQRRNREQVVRAE